jgi:glycosyltransferase involved in cell wall biosynthesis
VSLRVAHVITESAPFGGAQRNTLLSVVGLAARGVEAELVCGPGGRLVTAAREAGVPVHVVNDLVRRPAPVHDVRALVALVRLFRAGKYDVVHTHSVKAGLLGRVAARLAGIPCIVHTIHGVPFVIDRRLRSRVYLTYERWLAPHTHRVVCVGEVLRQEVASWGVIPSERLQTIYSGIDFDAYAPARPVAAVKQALGLEDAWPIVGSVGRLTECKAQWDLIDGLAVLLRRMPAAALVLVGDGELREALDRQRRALGVETRVHLLGERDDVPDLLPMFDVYAMSSRFEGVGRALTEAMYAARPIVATPVYGVREVIRHEETGLVVPTGAPDAVASAIERLANDRALAARLGAAARETALTLMDGRRMVDDLEHLYERELQHVRYRRHPVSLA